MKKDLITELIEGPSKAFSKHLILSGNDRILFSAPYGYGKTTFLKEFFTEGFQESLNSNVKYKSVHLYPVNYSVASNEDIFKYLKYDIIYELLMNNELQPEINNFSALEAGNEFIKNNIFDIVAAFIGLVPTLGKEVTDFYKDTKVIFEKFKEYYTALNEDDFSKLETFRSSIEKTEGSIYESNFYTEFIQRMLLQLKGDNNESIIETVLILDDLDRIDPQHIFRLFNIFAAHFDNKYEAKNKFGFDKVIFVCDLKNIRNIFKSIFGGGTDFNGYIDKFYSKYIFEYSYTSYARNILRNIVESFTVEYSDDKKTNFDSHAFYEDFNFIIESFVQAGAINLRALLKYYKKSPHIPQRMLGFKDAGDLWNLNVSIVALFDGLIQLLGDSNTLFHCLERAESHTLDSDIQATFSLENSEYKYRLGSAMLILDSAQNKMNRPGEHSYTFISANPYGGSAHTFVVKYELKKNSYDPYCTVISVHNHNGDTKKGPNIFFAYRKTLEFLINRGYYS